MSVALRKPLENTRYVGPASVSIILHIAIVAMMLINIDWPVQHHKTAARQVIDAFVVSDIPKKTIVKPKPKPVNRDKPKKIKPKVDDNAIRLQREKAEREKAERENAKALQQQRLKKQQQAQREAEKKRLAEKQRLAEEQRLKAEALQEAQALQQLYAEQQAQQQILNQKARLSAQYKAAIRDRISRQWIKPATIGDNDHCEVLVQQIPGGEIVNIHVSQCVGGEVFRRSVEDAILKVQTLPYQGFEKVFDRTIQFMFFEQR